MSDNTSIDKVVNVTLQICEGDPTEAGWVPVDSSDDTPYGYKFTGGSTKRQNGNIVHKIDGISKKVVISLRTGKPKRYQLVRAGFLFDDHQQLTTDPIQDETATLHNTCVVAMDAHYGVQVRDSKKNVTLVCDPAIRNKPV